MARVVIEIPDEHNELVVAAEALAEQVVQVVDRAKVGGKALDYAPIERKIADLSGAVERAAHLAILRSLDVDAPRIVIDGALCANVA